MAGDMIFLPSCFLSRPVMFGVLFLLAIIACFRKLRKKEPSAFNYLPDDILLIIFSRLPIESIARVGVVCKRWNHLFYRIQLDTSVLDFGPDFASNSIDKLVGSVGLSLRLFGNKLKSFKLKFDPSISLMSPINSWLLNCWLRCVVRKKIEKLEMDFCVDYDAYFLSGYDESEKEILERRFKLPSYILKCETLTHLKLSRSNLSFPSDFSGFRFLTELCFIRVNITDNMLEKLLGNCPSLDVLNLRECFELRIVKIWGETLQLKSLEYLNNFFTSELQIHAPNLRTFHFNGDCSNYNFRDISSLVDAIICAVACFGYRYEYNRVFILDKLRHVQILTISYAAIQNIINARVATPELFPITFYSLRELQILFKGINSYYALNFFYLFKDCTFPALEKLFVELDVCHYYNQTTNRLELSLPRYSLHTLRMVKISSFQAQSIEIQMVKFLLINATELELLLLVSPPPDLGKTAPLEAQESAAKELNLFPRASSKAQILLYAYGEGDNILAPSHTESQYSPFDRSSIW